MTTIVKNRNSASGKKPDTGEGDAAIRQSLGKIGKKLLVLSGKGGVGKSSVSVNLAIALAAREKKVGIMDVDIHGPDIPRMLGLSEQMVSSDGRKLLPVRYSRNVSVVSIETLMQTKDDAIIWRGPMKHAAIRQFIGDVEWGELDFLIIDSPPGTGDEPLSVAQTISDAGAVIVTTPQEISLADVRKSISFCKRLKMKILGIVENMSGFTCPNCGGEIALFGSGGGEKTALKSGLPFLGKIPFDLNMVRCGDTGTSFQETYKYADVSVAYAGIVEKIIAG